MAENSKISQIKLPNGSTYDIKDSTSGYTTNTGTITSVKTTAGAHTTINVSSGAANFNVPTKTSHLTNDSGFLTSETDPVFSASAAAGITSTDISNWNAKVSDDKTWGGVVFGKGATYNNIDQYIPYLNSNNSTSAGLLILTNVPAYGRIPKYNSDACLISTTPSANDNSTKVATTAYVDAAIPKVYSSTNTGGYLTMATLPIYDGTVV